MAKITIVFNRERESEFLSMRVNGCVFVSVCVCVFEGCLCAYLDILKKIVVFHINTFVSIREAEHFTQIGKVDKNRYFFFNNLISLILKMIYEHYNQAFQNKKKLNSI